MILPYKITFEELSKVGKDYNWPNHLCKSCKRNMWGHGYVARYSSILADAVYLKRYRCPDCRTVVTVRPEGYWPRIRSSILAVFEALKSKLSHGLWPGGFSRQRGGHWLNRFVGLARMEMKEDLSLFLVHCQSKKIPFFP